MCMRLRCSSMSLIHATIRSTALIGGRMFRRVLARLAVIVLLLSALPVPVFAQEKRGVDVVVILDTSGPMLDAFDKFCASFPSEVAALQQRGFDLQVTILG